MKYRVYKGMLAALLVSITFFYPLLAPTPHRIDDEHFQLIREGMTEQEVEAIFAVPPAEYDCATPYFEGIAFSISTSTELTAWTGRIGAYYVLFDANGKVTSKSRYNVRVDPFWTRFWLRLFAA